MSKPSARLLVVDDDPVTVDLLKEVLKNSEIEEDLKKELQRKTGSAYFFSPYP